MLAIKIMYFCNKFNRHFLTMIYTQTFRFLLLVVILFAVSSCTQYKKIVYLQDRYGITDSTPQTISIKDNSSIRLIQGDNLYINVYGTDLGQIDIFNKHPFSSAYQNEFAVYMQGYMVDDSGYVELPVIGKLMVLDKTLTETQDIVQNKLNEYIVGAVVEVRLLSFQITVLGEVRSPGAYTFLRRDISIFDALGKAGDMLNFGDKQSVLLMRNKGGKSETYEIDLTSSDFFQSDLFYLEPNDVIYVKPLRSKMITVNSTTISIVLASFTSLILFLNYLQ